MIGYLDEPMKRVALRGRVVHPWRRLRFHEFGPYSVLHKPAWIYAPQLISVGEAVLALHGLWLSVEKPAHGREAPVIRIGDRVAIRPHCTIAAAESIVIESDVVISSFTTVLDSDHTFDPERQPHPLHTPLATAPTRIGRGTWVGERCAILRGSNVGRYCAIGANSVVRGEIPDYSVAVGAPARVVGSTVER